MEVLQRSTRTVTLPGRRERVGILTDIPKAGHSWEYQKGSPNADCPFQASGLPTMVWIEVISTQVTHVLLPPPWPKVATIHLAWPLGSLTPSQPAPVPPHL